MAQNDSPDAPETGMGVSGSEPGQRGPRGPLPSPTVQARKRALAPPAGGSVAGELLVWGQRGVSVGARGGLLLALGLISWKSLAPAPDMAGVPHLDKLMHVLAYAVVAGLGVAGGLRPRWAVALAAGWGLGIEVAQGLMAAGREASAADALANLVGAVIGALAASRLATRLARGLTTRTARRAARRGESAADRSPRTRDRGSTP